MTPQQIQALKVYQQRKAAYSEQGSNMTAKRLHGKSKASKFAAAAKKKAKYSHSQNTITSMLSATKVVEALL